MSYEILVCLNNRHFFATAERSISTMGELQAVYKILAEKFPESEGFSISASRIEHRGTSIDITQLKPRVIGWHLAVHLDDDTAFVHGVGTQEWDNLLIDAHEIFDTTYRGEHDEPLVPKKIDVYAEMSDGENVHRFTWNNKEEVA